MTASWDVFFSYRRHDLAKARPLLDALTRAGIRVWRDEQDIPDQASITEEIRHGIANSKALLAFYSLTYPLSNPCQQEITLAWLAAERIDQLANRRVWIANPEASFEHLPELLRDPQSRPLTGDDAQLAAIVQATKERVDGLGSTLLGSGVRSLPAYHFMSPIQANRFVGRTREMWDLHGNLTANRRSIVSGVYGQTAAHVRGLGGNGKSLLAREYAIRFGPAYPGGVFWLNAYGHDDTKGPLSPEQLRALRQDQIREFAVRMGLQVEGLKPDEIEAFFWRTTEKRGDPCLWIVDDLPSGLTPTEMENACDARWAGASTLVTTRSREYGGIGSALDLDVLSRGEAFALLFRHRQPSDDAEENGAHRIVDLLGYHPLAVDVAGGYLAQGVEGFESYAIALENPNEDAVEFGNSIKESLPTGHERSISATLLKSIRHLGPEGRDLLRLASVLAIAPIPMSVISDVFELLHPGGAAKNRTLAAVDQAGALSLCERSGDDARTVHTLVGRTMRFAFPGEEQTEALRTAAVRALTHRLELPAHVGEHFKIGAEMPHARHLVTNDLQTEDDVKLALWVARLDHERADYVPARKLQEQVLETCRRVLGNEHPTTLSAMLNLAETLNAQADLSGARKLQEQALTASRRVLGEEHLDTLIAMNNLAQTLNGQGDLLVARNLQELVLAARCRLLGEAHPETLAAKLNLAQTLNGQGDLHGAREHQEQVLAARRSALGEQHPDTLTAMNNLAGTLYAQADVSGARNLQEQVLAARRRVLGEQHPDTLTAMNNLAVTLRAQGDLARARKLQEEVLQARRRLLGSEHPDTLMAMNNLAGTLKDQGDLVGARKLRGQALELRRRLLGAEHPATLNAMNNLAILLSQTGDREGAIQLLRECLPARREVLGENHPDTIATAEFLKRLEASHEPPDLI